MNFNVAMAKAAQVTIVEIEELVPVGSLDPAHVHLPGIFVDRIIVGKNYEKRIERLALSDDDGKLVTHNQTKKGKQRGEDNGDADRKRHSIVTRAAQEFRDGDYANLGIGIPMLTSNFITSDKVVMLQSENGILGLGQYPRPGKQDADFINAGKETVTIIPGGCLFGSDESFAMIRG